MEEKKRYYSRPRFNKESNNDMVFGTRAVIEAILSGKDIDNLYIKKGLESETSKELFDVLKGSNIPVKRVPIEKLNRFTRKNHQGVVAFVSAITYQRIEDIIPTLFESGKMPFILLLDGITDVRNFGAIARTAECAGIDAIVIPSHNSVTVNADAIKTSAGALHNIPVCREISLHQTVRFLKDSGVKIVAASEKADKDYTQADYTGPVAIIMGAEDTGIDDTNLKNADELVSIPINGKISSLNVSVAAGVMIYEAIRQKNKE